MTQVSRRGLIVGFAIGAVGVVGAAALIRSQSVAGLFRNVLEHYLGPIAISDADLDEFIAHFQDKRGGLMPNETLGDLWTLARRSGLQESARSMLPQDTSATIERFERWVLAEFHTVTDMGWRTTAQDTVAFLGASACLNPFAQFDAV